MTTQDSERKPDRPILSMTQPTEMKTQTYVYGVDVPDGDDAWAMFEASTAGDISQVKVAAEERPPIGQRSVLVPVSNSQGRERGAYQDR